MRHGCPRARAARWGSREAGSRRSLPAFPVSAYGGRWRDADPASDGRRDRLKPRGQTGHLDACERWGPPGSPPPWAMRTCPCGRGAERGRKWEEIGDDTPGLPPRFGRGDLVHYSPPPRNPRPPPNHPAEAGGGGGRGLCDSNNLGKKNSRSPRLVSPRRLRSDARLPPSPFPAASLRSEGTGKGSPARCYLFNVLVPRPPL